MSAKEQAEKVGKYSFHYMALVKRLAKLEFEQWKHWASEILRQKEKISNDRAERWRKLFSTEWDDLPDEIKQMDYTWAFNVLDELEDDPITCLVMIGDFIFNQLGLDWAYTEDPEGRFVSDFIKLIEDSKTRLDKVRS